MHYAMHLNLMVFILQEWYIPVQEKGLTHYHKFHPFFFSMVHGWLEISSCITYTCTIPILMFKIEVSLIKPNS